MAQKKVPRSPMHVTDFQGFLVKVLGKNYVLFAAVFKMQCNTHILQAQQKTRSTAINVNGFEQSPFHEN